MICAIVPLFSYENNAHSVRMNKQNFVFDWLHFYICSEMTTKKEEFILECASCMCAAYVCSFMFHSTARIRRKRIILILILRRERETDRVKKLCFVWTRALKLFYSKITPHTHAQAQAQAQAEYKIIYDILVWWLNLCLFYYMYCSAPFHISRRITHMHMHIYIFVWE